jgi:FkbM family methyltransferase
MSNPIHDHLRDSLLQLLAEPLEHAQSRERNECDQRLGTNADQLILFGAGNLGRKVLSVLRRTGQEPVAFMDNNPRLWGQEVEGVTVLSPADAARKFDAAKVGVLTTIYYGEATDRMADRLAPLYSLGFRQIALFGHLGWKHPDVFLPHYSLDLPSRALADAANIVRAFDLFQDAGSREVFLAHIRWRLTLDYDLLPPPVPETIYFNKRLVRPIANEFLIDGGAFTGDTIESFLSTFGRDGFDRVLAFEPDPKNYATLTQYVGKLGPRFSSRITPFASALGERPSTVQVETSGGPSSRVGVGDHAVQCRAIDEFGDAGSMPTFIKLDIEGYEPQALSGARNTLRINRPVVASSVYHAQNHLWKIVLQLQESVPDHHFYLAPHVADGWDLVLYAVPSHRLVAGY